MLLLQFFGKKKGRREKIAVNPTFNMTEDTKIKNAFFRWKMGIKNILENPNGLLNDKLDDADKKKIEKISFVFANSIKGTGNRKDVKRVLNKIAKFNHFTKSKSCIKLYLQWKDISEITFDSTKKHLTFWSRLFRTTKNNEKHKSKN